jgi:hypothetical protein
MSGIPRIIRLAMVIALVAILQKDGLSAEYTQFQYATPSVWEYLRLGLNYLESPQPFFPPETVSPNYVHPDLKGFGAYGFSPRAYQDVQRAYPFFKDYLWQDILESQELYELANRAFADWLLKNLQGYIPRLATPRQVFDILQKAWNVGLSGFKKGRRIIPSRALRAEEFKTIWVLLPDGIYRQLLMSGNMGRDIKIIDYFQPRINNPYPQKIAPGRQ